ncbi:MAG: F0F1 ATP synthase subunit delta [Minisyncoccia bacterium]
MKPENYAHALSRLIDGGDTPAAAVKKLYTLLTAQGREKLMSSIGRAFERLMAREGEKERTTLFVARKKDEAVARKQSGAKDANVDIDESLIGGWRLEAGETLLDASWKNSLLTIYQNTTRT